MEGSSSNPRGQARGRGGGGGRGGRGGRRVEDDYQRGGGDLRPDTQASVDYAAPPPASEMQLRGKQVEGSSSTNPRGQTRGGRDGGGVENLDGDVRDYSAPPLTEQTSLSSSSSSQAVTTQQDPPPPAVLQGPPTEKMESMTISVAPSSQKVYHPARRPNVGTVGTKCVLRANHFLVKLSKNYIIYHYDVAIDPEVRSKAVCHWIINNLVEENRRFLGNKFPVYDGKKSLYTVDKLPFDSKSFVIKRVDEGSGAKREKEFQVTIRHAAKADLSHLQSLLSGRLRDTPQEVIQALDVVLRYSPSQKFCVVGRSFFSEDFGMVDLQEGTECWRGYYQSLRPTQMGLSLNIDLSATAFYKPGSLVEFVTEFLNADPRSLSEKQHKKLKRALIKLKVEVTHRGSACRRYRVVGITDQRTCDLRFTDETGSTKSVVQYFLEQYGMQLKYVNWPAIRTGSDKKPIFLPMEVCKITPGQKYSKKLSETQVSNMLKATCQKPHVRDRNIVEVAGANTYNRDRYVQEFGITVSDNMTTVDARVLPPPKIKYHGSGAESVCVPSLGQWNMIGKRMLEGATVKHWACVNFSRLNVQVAQTFFNELVKMGIRIGMKFPEGPIISLRNANHLNLKRALVDIYREAVQANKEAGDSLFLFVLLPETRGLIYADLKRICETELGIMSQCCLPRNAQKMSNQYLENVALKINAKAGGVNAVLDDVLAKRLPLVSDRPTIIFGADVTHPSPGEDLSPSIAAVVASQDWPGISKYCGLISAQAHRQEIIADLHPDDDNKSGGMIKELLVSFYKSTGRKPERIIFFRDGVSEGQFAQVLDKEMKKIKKACMSIEANYSPPVTFVIVQKRHHTRFFSSDKRFTDKSGNVLPGTVVDTKICHPSEFDFYLCSHAGIQGTSRPAHYNVIYDENKFSADQMQYLINNMCYTYARCTKAVSVVPPAYYAHLLAFRARYYYATDSDTRSGDGGPATAVEMGFRPLPRMRDNIKRKMFFC